MKYSSLDELTTQLREVAELSHSHPDWSCVKIAKTLGIRSQYVCVRFRKIAEIAESLIGELLIQLLLKTRLYSIVPKNIIKY